MSSSIATQNTAPLTSGSSQSSHIGVSRSSASNSSLVPHPLPSQFREIHKNTWLKRLTADGKKITVGTKKSERHWVVFCVHDDTVALLEGYAEPRQTGAHIPEWVISLQDTLHISHALIPNSHEFEFVVTLTNEVIRFHAMSWDTMQEWVTTLRSKLREMKILSPRENLYTKLPEIKAPLLPTRDPTSPLPATPPVPAAIVPGVERVIPQSAQVHNTETIVHRTSHTINGASNAFTNTFQSANNCNDVPNTTNNSSQTRESTNDNTSTSITNTTSSSSTASTSTTATTTTSSTQLTSSNSSSTPNMSAMSNTLSQNFLNLLSDPIISYSEQINDASANSNDESCSEELNLSDDEFLSPILRKSCAQLLLNNNFNAPSNAVLQRASADHVRNLESLLQCDPLIPRPQTSRSHSAGAVDKSKKDKVKNKGQKKKESDELASTTQSSNHITDIEINDKTIPTVKATTAAASCLSVPKEDISDVERNITIIQVSTKSSPIEVLPKLPSKTSTADVFTFPEGKILSVPSTSKSRIKQHEYKSNVQIIPSSLSNSNSSTIQVLSPDVENVLTSSLNTSAKPNDYTIPVKSSIDVSANSILGPEIALVATTSKTLVSTESSKITTVHVPDMNESKENLPTISSSSVAIYGTCYTTATDSNISTEKNTPQVPKKIILSASNSGITSISVNNNDDNARGKSNIVPTINEKSISKEDAETNIGHNAGNIHYEQVFLSSSAPPVEDAMLQISSASSNIENSNISQKEKLLNAKQINLSRKAHNELAKVKSKETTPLKFSEHYLKKNKTSQSSTASDNQMIPVHSSESNSSRQISSSHSVSPALRRRHLMSPNARSPPPSTNQTAALVTPIRRMPLLTRGLTEAAITRPSRKDLYNMKLASNYKANNKSNSGTISNNNEEANVFPSSSNNAQHHPLVHPLLNRTNSELLEQRRRSSSTSDSRTKLPAHSGSNNNDLISSLANSSPALRIQQPPVPFPRGAENGYGNMKSPPVSANNSPAKRMTIREQQVMQIRREIMHPGGVRLQLRRKDCIGSIAWVDAFGAVWVAGWKQKEHPVLYNALHIGDQLLSIAGVSISSAAEANKIIRNTNTLFVEVLVRRIPFGRAYAIRREREGQCLGLIRDGNTATIVDIVPNSLTARHGLPPKAQSCDGANLTFWVLTEINGRPLNLFFKENEIRDRLNSVGRDISILVQPSDLIAKLKKQLKSLRGYKDYLVQ